MKTIRSEFTANVALSSSVGQDVRRMQANGWSVGQHALKPTPARCIFTRPTMMQRIVRAVLGWL